jgi:type II secretory pathway component PulF
MLDALALRSAQRDYRIHHAGVILIYPLLVGVLLQAVMAFVFFFILPKFHALFREMGLGLPFAYLKPMTLGFLLAGALFWWGLLAFTWQVGWIGRYVWWHVPWAGEHLRMEEQAHLARDLGLMLQAGATLEEAVACTERGGAGGKFRAALREAAADLHDGVTPGEAFRAHGRWREEFLWALDVVSQGAAPAATFEAVAEVLESRAESCVRRVNQLVTPVAVLISASGVGVVAYALFGAMLAISRRML